MNDSPGMWLRLYAEDGDPAHLDRAIAFGPAGYSPADVAETYVERYRLHGRTADLDAATAIVQASLRTRPDPILRATLLRHRAAWLVRRSRSSPARLMPECAPGTAAAPSRRSTTGAR